jgi:putative DNA primase/helicase
VDSYLHQLRYVPKFGKWMVWEEHRWRVDEDGAITRRAMEHSQALLAAASRFEEAGARRLAAQQALSVGNMKYIRPMLDLARADERIVVPHTRLDADPWLLGVQNGVVDLRSGTFRAGRRSDLITKCAARVTRRAPNVRAGSASSRKCSAATGSALVMCRKPSVTR